MKSYQRIRYANIEELERNLCSLVNSKKDNRRDRGSAEAGQVNSRSKCLPLYPDLLQCTEQGFLNTSCHLSCPLRVKLQPKVLTKNLQPRFPSRPYSGST